MKNLLLVVTGSIAAFKAAALASKLAQDGFDVRVVLSAGAKEFVGTSTFEGLTGNRVHTSTFAEGDAMAHIDLARWANLMLVYPASANTIAKFAHGLASDLASTLFLATKGPVWIAPAMNPAMLEHPATRANLETIRGFGHRIVESAEGRMACGEIGQGRLPEPEAMLEEIRSFFSGSLEGELLSDPSGDLFTSDVGSQPKRILVTAGGTSEPIDPVRVITNTSTGETGVRIANALADAGERVTLLLSKSSPFASTVSPKVERIAFDSFEDLDRKIETALKTETQVFVHAAAVSDYSVDHVETTEGKRLSQTQKIHSGESLKLVLRPNPKILDRVRGYSKNPNLRIVSFKLSTAKVAELDFSGYSSDWIVQNTVSEIERGSDRHRGEVFARVSATGLKKNEYRSVSRFQTKPELCATIVSIVKEVTL